MKVSTKVKIAAPKLAFKNMRANSLGRKVKKFDDENKHPLAWRNAYVLKRAKKVAKTLKVELKVQGFASLPKAPFIIAPNHSSSFDAALILMALENKDAASETPNFRPTFLAKKELEKNKRFKGYAQILSTFYIDRNNIRESVEVIDKMIAYVKEKKSVAVIFPEGTRSEDGSLNEFKGGAFRSAKKDFLPIVPVTINNALSITDTSRKEKLVVEVIFHQAIKPINILTMDTQTIAKIVQQKVQSKLTKPEGKRSKNDKKVA